MRDAARRDRERPDLGQVAADQAPRPDQEDDGDHAPRRDRESPQPGPVGLGGATADVPPALGLAVRPEVGAQDVANPGAAVNLEPPDLGISDHPLALQRRPGPSQCRRMGHGLRPGAQGGGGVARPPGQQLGQGLDRGEQQRLRQDPQQVEPPVAHEHGADSVGVVEGADPAAGQRVVPAGAEARGQGFEMADVGSGRHDDPGPEHLGPPAEVEVLAEQVDMGIEAGQRGEQIGPHQIAAAGGAEHVAHRVVLLLIELTPLDQPGGHTRLVDAQADRQEMIGPLPLDELGRHHPGVAAEGLLEQDPGDVRGQTDIVMAEQVVGGPLHDRQGFVGGPGEAHPAREPVDVGARQDGRHPGGGVFGAGGVDHQNREVRVVLGSEAGEGLLQPRTRITGDDDRHDGRRGRLGLDQRGRA